MLNGQDIVCVSSIEWGFLWQGHQEIASRLARAGNRVLYIENTGVRSPGLKDAGRVASRFGQWLAARRSHGVRCVAPGIYVCSPLVLPPFGTRWQKRFNRRFLLPAVRRAARRLGMRDVVLWTYLPTDTAFEITRFFKTRRGVTVYYCVADFAQLTPQARQLEASEKAVCRASDLIFAQGPELAAHCRRWNENVHIFPFGVNLDAFPFDPSPDHNRQNILSSLPRPIMGYVGGVHRHMDFKLLAQMARARPDWSWVFVGALQADAGELADLPNVHLLGQKPHDALADYIRAFDVCLVPYVSSAFTDTVVPTKINEYLAVGQPVVATRIPAVHAFNEQHDILLTASNEPESFLAAIEAALGGPRDAATRQRRREVATLGDWQARLEAMSDLIQLELDKKASPDHGTKMRANAMRKAGDSAT